MPDMKYRRLTLEELQELETEFVRFLAAQSIAAEDWEKIKAQEAERAEQLLDYFSDVVFEKVIFNVEYLEQKHARDIRTYHCLPDKLVMNGLLLEGENSLDLRENIDPTAMMQIIRLSGAKLKFFTAERVYRSSREQEIFQLMQQGALISKDGYLFHQLEALKQA